MTTFLRKLHIKNTRKVPRFQFSFSKQELLNDGWTRSNEVKWITCTIDIIPGPNLTLHWKTCNTKPQIANCGYIIYEKISTQVRRPTLLIICHTNVMETYLPGACATSDQVSVFVYFNISDRQSWLWHKPVIINSRSNTNNLDKLNKTLLNTTLEVGLVMRTQ